MKDMLRRYFFAAIGSALAFLIFAPTSVFAASLFFASSAQTVAVGQTFVVTVEVSSADQAMNAASGDISFPSGKLRVLSVSNSNSVMSLWVQNPTFSNAVSGGDINFAGVVLNPGFTGVDGNVVTVRFQAIGTGDAALSFLSGSVLANDGNGTEILSSLGTASYAITPAPPLSVSTPSSTPTSTPSSTLATITVSVPTTTTSVAPVTTPVIGSWLDQAAQFLIAWGLIILLAILLLAAIVALAYYIVNRLRRFHVSLSRRLIEERKELRDDLKRIEKELEADRPHSEIDLSAPGVRKKQERIRKEIEHLDDDLKRDIKENG
jgi:Cohesin domain